MSSPLFDSLRAAIRDSGEPRVTAEQVLDALGARAFGLGVIVVMAPVCLPMPPGVPTVAGVILAIFAVQLILGFRRPWLPLWVRRLSIERDKLLAGIDALERRLKFVERVSRPRLLFLTGRFGARLIGIVLLVLAGVLILPIPFLGNLPPAIAASILAFALAQRDGLIVIVGFGAAVAAVMFTWSLAAATARWLYEFFN